MTNRSDVARAERLKTALRNNLKRRKAQARGRAEEERPTPPPHEDERR